MLIISSIFRATDETNVLFPMIFHTHRKCPPLSSNDLYITDEQYKSSMYVAIYVPHWLGCHSPSPKVSENAQFHVSLP